MAYIGIDFGTGHMSVCAYHDANFQEIALGEENEGQGRKKSYRHPVGIRFTEDRMKLLGFAPFTDHNDTSRGLKQALDNTLCKNNSGQGARFRELCERYSNDDRYIEHYKSSLGQTDLSRESLIDIALVIHFEHLWKCIAEHAKSNDFSGTIGKIRIGMPMIWYEDETGQKIRDRILRCAVKAGFPKERLDDASEESCAAAYVFSQPDRLQSIHPETVRASLLPFLMAFTQYLTHVPASHG